MLIYNKLIQVSATIVICAIISGYAAKKLPEQETKVEFYGMCYQPILDLRNEQKDKKEKMSGMEIFATAYITVLATAAGAVGAYALQSPLPIYQGFEACLSKGGIGRTVYLRKGKYYNDLERLGSHNTDFEAIENEADKVRLAASASADCYASELDKTTAEIDQNPSIKVTLQPKIEEINCGIRENIKLLDVYSDYLKTLENEYEEAFAKERDHFSNPVSPYHNAPKEAIERYYDRLRNKDRNLSLIDEAAAKSSIIGLKIEEIQSERDRILELTRKLSLIIN